ncbi:diaminopimelate epimerase [Chloroflexota bacterium]
MEFTKTHGAGNDFIILEAGSSPADWSGLAIAMCDRHLGIGADGLLVLAPSEIADFRMRIFNADGSESDTCGNGLRCLSRYYIDKLKTACRNGEIQVETMAGIRKVIISGPGADIIKTAMGVPLYKKDQIPVIIKGNGEGIVYIKDMINIPLTIEDTELHLDLVSMGNPHAVLFGDNPPADFPLSRIGPEAERNEVFPAGVNFEAARVTDRNHIEARVWERGVGETLACGSGACAITVAARLHGFVDNNVEVKLPGGILEVEWDGIGEVFLSGPTEKVFTGNWPDNK